MSTKLPTNKERAERALEALEGGRFVFTTCFGDRMDIPGSLVARPIREYIRMLEKGEKR